MIEKMKAKLQGLMRYRFLMEQLVTRDFKTKYKRSVLGIFWSFLNPLLMMAVQWAVFSKLMRFGNVEHYAVYLLCGIVMFNSFNDSCTQAMRAIVGNASLITKVYVPKYIYPISKVLSASVNMFISMLPLMLVAVLNRLWPAWSWLVLPVGLILLVLFTMGMGLLLSALMVFFRDVEFLWGVFSTIWMYATPIIYPVSLLYDWMQKLEWFNPLYHYIDFIRVIVIGRAFPSFMEFLVCLVWALFMLLVGGLVFKGTQDKFIFHI